MVLSTIHNTPCHRQGVTIQQTGFSEVREWLRSMNTLPLSTVVLPLDRKRPHTEITGAMQVCTHDTLTSVIQAQRSLHASFQMAMSGVDSASSSSVSLLKTKLPLEQRVPFNNNVLVSPQEFFMTMLLSRGYPGTSYCSLKCGYHNSPTVSIDGWLHLNCC